MQTKASRQALHDTKSNVTRKPPKASKIEEDQGRADPAMEDSGLAARLGISFTLNDDVISDTRSPDYSPVKAMTNIHP